MIIPATSEKAMIAKDIPNVKSILLRYDKWKTDLATSVEIAATSRYKDTNNSVYPLVNPGKYKTTMKKICNKAVVDKTRRKDMSGKKARLCNLHISSCGNNNGHSNRKKTKTTATISIAKENAEVESV